MPNAPLITWPLHAELLPSRFARDRLGVDALNFTYTYDVTVTDMFFKCVVCLHPDLCALVDTQTLRLGSGIKVGNGNNYLWPACVM